MLHLQELEVTNFITYKHTKFKFNKYFTNDRLLLILGKNKDLPEVCDSNGAGKSLIYEAFCWCLFDRTTRGGLKDGVIGTHGTSTNVRCTILNDNNGARYTVSRYRKDSVHGNNVIFKVNDETQKFTIKTDVNKFIWHTLGVSYNKFINTCIFKSDDERKRFVYMGDADRKQLLSEMRGTDVFPDCEKLAKAELKKHDASVEAVDLLLQNDLQMKRKARHDLKDLAEAQQTYEKEIKARIKKLRHDRAEILIDYNARGKVHKAEITKIEKRITRLENKIKKPVDRVTIETRKDKLNEQLTKMMKKMVDLEANIAIKNAEYKDATASTVGAVCKYCGTKVTGETLEKHLTVISALLADYYAALAVLDGKYKTLKDRKARLLKRLVGIDTLLARNIALKSKAKVAQEALSGHVTALKTLKGAQTTALKSVDDQLIEIENGSGPYISMMDRLLEDMTIYSKRIASHRTALTKLTSDRRYMQAWVKGYGREFIQHEALQGIVATFNSRIQHYANELTNGEVTVQLLTEKTMGTRKVRNIMDLDITDTSKTKPLPFKEWSTGERKRIEVITSFASVDLDQNVFAELFLDEMFDGVDATGMDKIMHLLEDKAHEGRNVVVLSHVPELQDHFDSTLLVTKDGGNSTVEYGG